MSKDYGRAIIVPTRHNASLGPHVREVFIRRCGDKYYAAGMTMRGEFGWTEIGIPQYEIQEISGPMSLLELFELAVDNGYDVSLSRLI